MNAAIVGVVLAFTMNVHKCGFVYVRAVSVLLEIRVRFVRVLPDAAKHPVFCRVVRILQDPRVGEDCRFAFAACRRRSSKRRILDNLLKSPALELGISENNSYLWMQKMSFTY